MLRGLSRSRKLQTANDQQNTKQAMSIQKEVPRVVQLKKLPLKGQSNQIQQVTHLTQSIRYHQLVGGVFDVTDPAILLAVTIPAPSTNIRKKHLVFKNSVYIISNWTHDKFPNVMYVTLRGYTNGYSISEIDVNNNLVRTQTDRVAALQLDQVVSTIDQSQVRTYQLRYALRDCVNWELPLSQTMLVFALKIDDSDVEQTLPLPNPMDINFEIRVAP